MTVLLSPDKFKGSLSALSVCEALERGLRRGWPEAMTDFIVMPIADGGEGTAEAVRAALKGRRIELRAQDPLGREIVGSYAWIDDGQPLAVIEMSEFSGYSKVRVDERDPLRSNTFGTGQALLHALEKGATRILLGIGGSATNDGGIGLAMALGYVFCDEHDRELPPEPRYLERLIRIVPPEKQPWADGVEVVVASDVTNPLLGDEGATAVYGPQKGVTPETAPVLEKGLARLAEIAERDLGTAFKDEPGSGAAGGLGFGLRTFCGAHLEPGFELIAGMIGLEENISKADLVITGEGSLDAQSLSGKGPVGVAQMARRAGKPVIGVAGRVQAHERLHEVFDGVLGIVDEAMPLERALAEAEELVERAGENLARLLRCGRSLQN